MSSLNKPFSARLGALALGVLAACAEPAYTTPAAPGRAQQWAIVVGINHYQHKGSGKLKTLRGAVNDAELLKTTLRGLGVDLPDSRVLLDGNATVERFQSAWREVLGKAQPGDRIIVTFAGHGGQIPDQNGDEEDKKDETLIFQEFNPAKPSAGRISDDELYDLFNKAKAYRILFVADTCHSGGMTRSVSGSLLPSRDGGALEGALEGYTADLSPISVEPDSGAEREVLEHVTYLNATDKDYLKIREIIPAGQNKVHGALSWAFAEAMTGGADYDRNKIVSRAELADYLGKRVPLLSDTHQVPQLLPRSGDEVAMALSGGSEPQALWTSNPALDQSPLPVKVEGGHAPAGLENISISAEGFRLRFEVGKDSAKVFNAAGDQVVEIPADDVGAWKRVIAKYRLMGAMDGRFKTGGKPVKITLQEGNGLHRLKERLNFSFDPESDRRYFLLFDLAGTGVLQFLYPLAKEGDAPALAKLPYSLPLDVSPPTGEDDLVGIFCQQPQPDAVALLASYDGKTPPEPGLFLKSLVGDCQIGRYAFFTAQ